MTARISEDCLIFYGFSPETKRFRKVFNQISNFVKNKIEIDPSGRFNFILYLESGPNYLDQFTLNSEHLLKTLKLLSNDIVKVNTAQGILFGLSLLIENFKKTSKRLFRLLVILDTSASNIPPNEFSLIEKLINDFRIFPFYIDIISLETQNNEELELLKKIANSCNGELYQIKNVDDLDPLLTTLVKKKFDMEYLYSRYILNRHHGETQTVYQSIADRLDAFQGQAICSICSQKDNKGIMQCPSCGILAHKKCWALWAINLNRVMPHIFRCPNCFYLLKLDEDFVIDVQLETNLSDKKLNIIKKKEVNEFLQESNIESKVKKAEDIMVAEIKAIINSKKGISEFVKQNEKQNELIQTIKICPICNNLIPDNEKCCPICNFFLS
ncbi:MAG: hypothetical protein ACFFA3_11600 [Promethearchaeota archaeon]